MRDNSVSKYIYNQCRLGSDTKRFSSIVIGIFNKLVVRRLCSWVLKIVIVRLRISRTKSHKENQTMHFSFFYSRAVREDEWSPKIVVVTLKLQQLGMATATRTSQICIFNNELCTLCTLCTCVFYYGT